MAFPLALPFILGTAGVPIVYQAAKSMSDALRNFNFNTEDLKNAAAIVASPVVNTVKSISEAMTPSRPTDNGSIDPRTGRYIATSDATRVSNPAVVVNKPRTYNRLGAYFYPTEAASDSVPQQTTAPLTSGATATPLPEDKKPEDEKKPKRDKPKNEESFKERLKRVLKNLKRVGTNTLIGAEYALGFLTPPGLATWGIYEATKPDKTQNDSILDNQLNLIIEILKAKQISENLKKIDDLLKQILSRNYSSSVPGDSLPTRSNNSLVVDSSPDALGDTLDLTVFK